MTGVPAFAVQFLARHSEPEAEAALRVLVAIGLDQGMPVEDEA